jgi:hypothetical protein
MFHTDVIFQFHIEVVFSLVLLHFVMRRACSPTIHYRGSSVNHLDHHTFVGEGFELMLIFEHQRRVLSSSGFCD